MKKYVPVPSKPTKIEVVIEGSRKANVSWTPPTSLCPLLNNTVIANGHVLWGDDRNDSREVTQSSNTHTWNNLTPLTNYIFCVQASTSVGPSSKECSENDHITDPEGEKTVNYYYDIR